MGFRPDGEGVARMMTELMAPVVREKADKIAAAAAATSPVGPESDPHRGEYKAAWRVEEDVKQGKPRPFDPNRRARATVVNDTPYAASIEYGNGRMEAQHVLTRAIDIARE